MNLSLVCCNYLVRQLIVQLEVCLKQSLNVLSVVFAESCKEMFVEVSEAITEHLIKRPTNSV
jgi:hypothetical protein